MATQQTQQGMKTNVTMKPAVGLNVPTDVNLPDGTTVRPAADGSISVETGFIPALLAAGWQVQVDANTTHVP